MREMQVTKKDRCVRRAFWALALAAACLLAGACSSGPKVINLGGSASRVTIETN